MIAENREEWEVEEAENLKRIREFQAKGHSHHCACRQVWGDGECECDLYQYGYDPYAWMNGLSGIKSATNAFDLIALVKNQDFRYMWE